MIRLAIKAMRSRLEFVFIPEVLALALGIEVDWDMKHGPVAELGKAVPRDPSLVGASSVAAAADSSSLSPEADLEGDMGSI
jgi:hypothetical protein